MYRLGVDIGGTKVNVGIIDANNQLLGTRRRYIKEIQDFTSAVRELTDELCGELGIAKEEIVSFGVGVPGTVSADGRRLLKAPNISILSETIVEELEKELSLPGILVQDSRAAAWGEYVCGGGAGAKSVVCITLGTGIGTGVVLDGKIYAGSLGSAGELGHIPVREGGRACGCGKKGCLEKYCAGGGLTITASELLGEGKTAEELFEAAKAGNEEALEAIADAVRLLGGAVVSIVNLLSPDCILFSGGLSAQEELYVNPLIEYVKEHCYTAGTLPELKRAKLLEYAPLIGAALMPVRARRTPKLSASIMCADALRLGQALDDIKGAGIQYVHCDIMDNHFVPNLMLPMEMMNRLHDYTDIPFDYHIMAENPGSIIEKLAIKAGDIISVHYESTNHLQLALSSIRDKGAGAAVAINPATPIAVLSEILPEIDMVLLMSVNPGFAGQKIVPSSFDKIRRLRTMLDEAGYEKVLIEVDGNCSFENVPKMYAAGADIFVVGTSSVFKKGLSIKEGTRQLYHTLGMETAGEAVNGGRRSNSDGCGCREGSDR